ncbi:hypothetical protein [Brachyspira alvinipulli]|uniref:hypothetical protein n=1 Tax=Brachyspira alvinipulli TaxID=84379 RepID=UPI000481EE8E|nr:hypothetical protein [Brachyspira alvinipulli]
MKNKKLFMKITILSIIIVIIVIVYLLGIKSRIGYLGDLEIDEYSTLKLNNLFHLKDQFVVDGEIDEEYLKNYILTNENITNYNYIFKVKYYDKLFRHSDIYGVYINTNKILDDNDFITKIEMNDNLGTPFGELTSNQIIDTDKIDNVFYVLKIKFIILIPILFICIILLTKEIKYIFCFFNKNKYKIYFCILCIYLLLIFILSILGLKSREGYISNFDLNTSRTFQMNGVTNYQDIKKNIDYKIEDYIYSNKNITNYYYSFETICNEGIFRNNIFYGVYINNINEIIKNNIFIKEIKMINYPGTIFGDLVSDNKLNYNDQIKNVNYILKVRSKIIVLFIYLTIIFMILTNKTKFFEYINNFKLYENNTNNILSKNDYLYIKISIFIYVCLFIFQYWLCKPGDFSWGDTLVSMQGDYTNANPIIITLFLHLLYEIFGYNVSYIFILNLLLWYSGLCLITISLYLRFRNNLILLVSLITFIPNFFFININHFKDVTSSLWVWFSYSLMFFMILCDTNKKQIILNIICFFTLIIGMLWRHNMIVTIYPIFIFITYNILKDKILTIKKYIISFIGLMLLFSIILVFIYKTFPILFVIEDNKAFNVRYTINHIFALQIAACATMSDDDSIIPNEWYMPNENFISLKKTYIRNPIDADRISHWTYSDRIFRDDINSNEIKKIWIMYIIKHPLSYTKHIINFSKNVMDLKIVFNSIDKLEEKFDEIRFSELRKNIYNTLYLYNINTDISFFALLSIVIFIITSLLWIFKKDLRCNILLFSLTTSISVIATIFIVIIFSPLPDYRYIHPIVPISVISFISFISFIFSIERIKNIIIELKSKFNIKV